jgi:phosphatidylethanolamine/phosphatidyl-N-methylethanolamine N-methyltransferase
MLSHISRHFAQSARTSRLKLKAVRFDFRLSLRGPQLLNPIHATENYRGHHAEAAYSRWAPVYDLIFDLPFHAGRLAAAHAAAAAAGPDGEILVIGVGTGLELPLLPGNVLVTGIDISPPMLRAAEARVARKRLDQVKSLRLMDAGALEFADGAFDVAVAPYVMSVVPNPKRALDEAWRVLRPGGSLVVMNHFAAPGGARAVIERRMETAAAWLGWHPNFPYSVVGDWIEARPDTRLIERVELPPIKLFTLLRIEKAETGRPS